MASVLKSSSHTGQPGNQTAGEDHEAGVLTERENQAPQQTNYADTSSAGLSKAKRRYKDKPKDMETGAGAGAGAGAGVGARSERRRGKRGERSKTVAGSGADADAENTVVKKRKKTKANSKARGSNAAVRKSTGTQRPATSGSTTNKPKSNIFAGLLLELPTEMAYQVFRFVVPIESIDELRTAALVCKSMLQTCRHVVRLMNQRLPSWPGSTWLEDIRQREHLELRVFGGQDYVYVTTVKKSLRMFTDSYMTSAILPHIPVTAVENPHNRYATAYLVDPQDVVNVIFERCGGGAGFKRLCDEDAAKRKKKAEARAQKLQHREQLLSESLRKVGMKLDPSLERAEVYIYKGTGKKDEVARNIAGDRLVQEYIQPSLTTLSKKDIRYILWGTGDVPPPGYRFPWQQEPQQSIEEWRKSSPDYLKCHTQHQAREREQERLRQQRLEEARRREELQNMLRERSLLPYESYLKWTIRHRYDQYVRGDASLDQILSELTQHKERELEKQSRREELQTMLRERSLLPYELYLKGTIRHRYDQYVQGDASLDQILSELTQHKERELEKQRKRAHLKETLDKEGLLQYSHRISNLEDKYVEGRMTLDLILRDLSLKRLLEEYYGRKKLAHNSFWPPPKEYIFPWKQDPPLSVESWRSTDKGFASYAAWLKVSPRPVAEVKRVAVVKTKPLSWKATGRPRLQSRCVFSQKCNNTVSLQCISGMCGKHCNDAACPRHPTKTPPMK